jgi:hypothetical protein
MARGDILGIKHFIPLSRFVFTLTPRPPSSYTLLIERRVRDWKTQSLLKDGTPLELL